jgi:hypothetical protein
VVIFYLRVYLYFFGRLDSGGETSPKATFLATTLGLRRLFFGEAISNPNVFFSFLKRIILEVKKTHLISASFTKGKNLILSEQNFCVQRVYFLRKIPQELWIFTQRKD